MMSGTFFISFHTAFVMFVGTFFISVFTSFMFRAFSVTVFHFTAIMTITAFTFAGKTIKNSHKTYEYDSDSDSKKNKFFHWNFLFVLSYGN